LAPLYWRPEWSIARQVIQHGLGGLFSSEDVVRCDGNQDEQLENRAILPDCKIVGIQW